jgi:hypothetical protein
MLHERLLEEVRRSGLMSFVLGLCSLDFVLPEPDKGARTKKRDKVSEGFARGTLAIHSLAA